MDNTTAKIIAGAILMLGVNILLVTVAFVGAFQLPYSTSSFEMVLSIISIVGLLFAAFKQYQLSYSFLFPPFRNWNE